jgi:dTDP-4-dehydrorhamnose 3,5-epimerase
MRLHETGLPGAWLLEHEPIADERGFFVRTWCTRALAAAGLPLMFVQGNLSGNRRRGTLRGLHYQRPPSREGKLVRCSRGEIYDVIVDLRCDSPTFLRHFGVTLTAASVQSLYVPPGFAHGFQTLTDEAEVTYAMTDFYQPEVSDGVRWNDPALGIAWPLGAPAVISPRDASYPDLVPATFTVFRG